jgi:hypothetical protein
VEERPTTGGRVVLDRTAVSAEVVIYRAQLLTPDADWRGDARIDIPTGEILFSWETDTPAEWLVAQAHAFLRGEWRARRGPDPEPWPTRVNRWREAKT